MTLAGKIVTAVLFLPIVALFLYSWIRVVLYLRAVFIALTFVDGGMRTRYLMCLSSMDLAAAAKLISTDAGRGAHDLVTEQYNRALKPTVLTMICAFLAIGIGFILQETGLVVFE